MILAVTMGLLADSTARATGLEAYLDQKALVELAEAHDLAELERVNNALPFHDPAIDIVFRSRAFALNPCPRTELALLETIPKNPLEFWYFYSITYVEAFKRSAGLAEIAGSYFEKLASIVVKRKQGYREFLLLVRFSDGEVAEQLDDLVERLRDASQERFQSALGQVDAETRRRVCGECDVPATRGKSKPK